MKMGRRPRCSSVTYRFRYAPLTPVRLGPPCRRPILIATIYLLFRGQDTRVLLFSVNSQELLKELTLVTDNPIEKIGLRQKYGPCDPKIQVSASAILRCRKIFFYFIRDFSAQELVERDTSVEVKFLRGLNGAPEVHLTVLRDQLQRVHFDVLPNDAKFGERYLKVEPFQFVDLSPGPKLLQDRVRIEVTCLDLQVAAARSQRRIFHVPGKLKVSLKHSVCAIQDCPCATDNLVDIYSL